MERSHDHEHGAGHSHSHETPASLKNPIFAIVINGGIVAFEMTFGLLIQSMALISDSVHNLSDIAHMLFSYWTEKVAHRPPNERKTYGYRKIEFIAAFVNSIGLSVVIAFVFWETGSEQKLLSVHLKSGEETPDHEGIIRAVQELLLHKYGNNHATLQILPASAGEMAHCN